MKQTVQISRSHRVYRYLQKSAGNSRISKKNYLAARGFRDSLICLIIFFLLYFFSLSVFLVVCFCVSEWESPLLRCFFIVTWRRNTTWLASRLFHATLFSAPLSTSEVLLSTDLCKGQKTDLTPLFWDRLAWKSTVASWP